MVIRYNNLALLWGEDWKSTISKFKSIETWKDKHTLKNWKWGRGRLSYPRIHDVLPPVDGVSDHGWVDIVFSGAGVWSLANVVVAEPTGAGMVDSAAHAYLFLGTLQPKSIHGGGLCCLVQWWPFLSFSFRWCLWGFASYFGSVSLILCYLGGWVSPLLPGSQWLRPSFDNGLQWCFSGRRPSLFKGGPRLWILGQLDR